MPPRALPPPPVLLLLPLLLLLAPSTPRAAVTASAAAHPGSLHAEAAGGGGGSPKMGPGRGGRGGGRDVEAPGTSAPCPRNPESLCFAGNLTFSIQENVPPDILGVLRPARLQHLCPEYAVSYVITKGSEDLLDITLSPDGDWQLCTKTQFDREEADKWEYTVECHISSSGTKARMISRNITVHIIDEDDSPPIANITTHEDYISNPEVKKGQSLNTGLLVVLDADSVEANNYEIEIDGEKSHEKLFDFSLKKYKLNPEKQVNNSSMSAMQQNGEGGSSALPSSTGIYIVVSFAKRTKLVHGVYMTNLTLTDVTLKGGEQGNNQVTIEFRLYVGSNNRFSKNKGSRNSEVEAHSKIITEEEVVDITSTYPEHVNLPASVSSYTRIAQPRRSAAPLDARLHPADSPFAVTPSQGILYLRSAPQLRPGASHLISIQWGTDVRNATVNVTVGASAGQARCQHLACAARKSAEACSSSCGVGAREWCAWRPGPPATAPRLSALYATCTPHTATCPDGACDELEELAIGICPQDCTSEVFGSARKNDRENGGRGIKSATGVCSCDPYAKCSCGPVSGKAAAAANSTTADRQETIDNKASFDRYHETCGESCFVAVVLGVMAAFSILLAGGVLARRRRMMAKRGGQHAAGRAMAIPLHPWDARAEVTSATSAALGMHSQIYGHDDDLSNPMPELPLLNVHQMQMQPRDDRWEVPRDALQLEGALGEGEFGLVLKARLRRTTGFKTEVWGEELFASTEDWFWWRFRIRCKNGPDCPVPYETVAVKTLKEGAGDTERAALESEFKLLQSVNHVNVVRLIGACTMPGHQSFLMVIEFAELGSLRNYLRKSRLSDMDGAPLRQLPIARPSANEMKYRSAADGSSAALLTPRHILSFAWQISKGMMYLSEMKLVHRDLAARNVLLTKKGICKISDFGLTRDVYEDEAYYKRSKGRVPVKWLAPESLSDHLYTTQSDVWSFGVLLWELVTLGSSPYPGVPLSGLYSLLYAGYRMQKPTNCSPELYRIMMCCWKLDPGERPSFQCLMASLEGMLEDEVEYLHLGALFAHNPTYFTSPLAGNSPELPIGNEAPCIYKVQLRNEDGEHPQSEARQVMAAHSTSGPMSEEERQWDWRELNEGEGDSSDAKTPLKTSFSEPDFNPANAQREFEDGYEVPISVRNRFSDSQDVVM